jgi:DNA-binding CsgD family transcriptional regulator
MAMGTAARRSFVLHVEGAQGPLVLQDLGSLRRAELETLAGVTGQLEEWMRPAGQIGRAEVLRRTLKLTRSQARVARLAAEGLTNKQVGQALGIRLRTVESHLTAAYRKLGVRSRHELGALFDEGGPDGPR